MFPTVIYEWNHNWNVNLIVCIEVTPGNEMQISEQTLQGGWWDLEYSEVMKMSLSKSDKSFPDITTSTSPIHSTTFITLNQVNLQ